MTTGLTSGIPVLEFLARSVLDAPTAPGIEGVLIIAPGRIWTRSAHLVGAAERTDEAGHDVAGELAAALGPERLARTAVAYIGCFASTADPAALVAEIASVSRVAGQVMVAEGEALDPPVASRAADLLRTAGLEVREHRFVPAIADEPVVRRIHLGPVPPQTGLRPVRVAVSDHQDKSRRIQEALAAAGQILTDDVLAADAVLIDHDVHFHGKQYFVAAAVAAGRRGFLYPHGADPALMAGWDGIYDVYPLLSGALVISDGHAQIARRFGYPLPLHTIGWPYCDQRDRRPGPVEKVLFAPTHPPYLGNPRYPGRNAEMFEKLLACPVRLTVRHIGTLEENGLWEVPGVTYIRGDMADAPGMLAQIDAADCVVADRSTFGNLSVARGATTVLWDTHLVFNNEGTRHPDNLDRYRDLLHHPFDADDGDMWDLIRAAAADTTRIGEWRRRFIGAPLDALAVTAAIRGI